MASHQTTNFQLCQWEADDEVLRTDFNADNLKIENALSAIKTVADVAFTPENSPIAAGSYVGNGAVKRKIEVGFTPRAVFVMRRDGQCTTGGYYYSGLAVAGSDANGQEFKTGAIWSDEDTMVAITEDGFYVNFCNLVRTNASGDTYHYIALR